jgi:hypothetical protein
VVDIDTLVEGDTDITEVVLCDIRGERDGVDDCELTGVNVDESEFFEIPLEVEDNVLETVNFNELDKKSEPECADIVGSPDVVGENDDEAEADSYKLARPLIEAEVVSLFCIEKLISDVSDRVDPTLTEIVA